MKSVPVDDRTVVTSVDRVIEGAPGIAAHTGQNVTVRLSARRTVAAGDRLVFHACSWIYGDGLAVRSIREEAVGKVHEAALAAGGDPVARKRARDVQEHIADADLVVAGRVSKVRPPAAPARAGARAVRGRLPAAPASEHDPEWREAVIDVDQVHKGRSVRRQLVVRFPASTDVRWYKAPKFRAGQRGMFVLHAVPTPSGAGRGARAAATGGSRARVYTALHPLDFHPTADPHGARAPRRGRRKGRR